MERKFAYVKNFLYLCSMKAKWTSLVDDLQGHIDSRHYARHIPGNGAWAAICQKPELSTKTKEKKASQPTCKSFSNYISISKEILNNAERRAAWQVKYEAAIRTARRYKKPIQGRLCDYVRHEVSEALKKGDPIEP